VSADQRHLLAGRDHDKGKKDSQSRATVDSGTASLVYACQRGGLRVVGLAGCGHGGERVQSSLHDGFRSCVERTSVILAGILHAEGTYGSAVDRISPVDPQQGRRRSTVASSVDSHAIVAGTAWARDIRQGRH
jgi:hypothetical protein